MIWFLLLLLVLCGVFLDSARLFLLGLLMMATKACPQVMLPSLGAVIWWVLKTSWKR